MFGQRLIQSNKLQKEKPRVRRDYCAPSPVTQRLPVSSVPGELTEPNGNISLPLAVGKPLSLALFLLPFTIKQGPKYGHTPQ